MIKNNNTLKYRVGQIEKEFKKDGVVFILGEDVKEIMRNHLPHIDAKVNRLTWLAGLNLFAIIMGILIAKYL